MGSREYAAAWGWTHFLLTGPAPPAATCCWATSPTWPRTPRPTARLADRVTAEVPAAPQRFTAHAATLGGRSL